MVTISAAQTWTGLISFAKSPGEVLVFVAAYLAEWKQGEIAGLPESARPPRLSCADDVIDYAITLARWGAGFEASLSDDGRSLGQLTAVMKQAAIRISQLAGMRHH